MSSSNSSSMFGIYTEIVIVSFSFSIFMILLLIGIGIASVVKSVYIECKRLKQERLRHGDA